MTYNYIFDEDIRNIMEIDVENNIIIIDEAHNVRKVCEDSKSVEIKSNDFEDINLDFDSLLNFDENEGFIEDFIKVRKKKKSPLEEISKNDIEKEKDIIKKIQKRFNNINIRNDNKGNELNFVEFLNIFINNEEKSNDKKRKKEIKYKDDELSVDSSSYNISDNISISNLKEHIELLNKVSMIYQDVFEKGTKINILIKIFNIISQLVNKISLQKSYTFFMENEKKTIYNKDTNELDKIDIIKKFNIFCFNPEIEFIDILNSHPFSIILTSGTLTPFKLLEDELKIKFKTTLENYHIVPKEQIKFKIITNYSQNGIFCFDYENRTNIEMIKALGNEIYYFCKNTTYGGILVFFTSYIYLNKCYKVWEEYGINFKIIKYKKIFKDSSRDKNLISSLKRDSNKNYILYSVFRGSSSEGIDFSDDCARVVICIGIPFADKKENRIKLKINYINNMKRDNKDFIDGNEWYIADAMTAVNQSLGRVIRHINDYGVLVCIDERYKRFEKYFSLWIKEQNKNNKDDNILDINQFFSEQRNKFKNIIQNDNLINSKEQDKKSGFNNIINMNKNSIFNNYELEIFKEYDENTKKLNIKKGLNTGEDMSSEENHQNNNNFNKINRTKFGCSFKLNEENINIINAKGLGYKTNYNDIYNSLLNKKHLICKEKKKAIENKLLFEKWNITKDNKFNFIYDSEQKKGYELLESLKEFINNNPKEFNKIINKYKL
jgi:DNA repair helicase Rad3